MSRFPEPLRNLWLLLTCSVPLSVLGDTSAPDTFARLAPEPDPIYAGQAFFMTLDIYNTGMPLDKSVSISGLPADTNLTLEPFQELSARQEQAGGRLFDIRRFRCRAVCHTGGNYILKPTLQGTRIEEVRSFFFVQRHLHPVMIPVSPLNLHILALPEEGRPESFTGAVGLFRFQADVKPLHIAQGDIVTVRIQIDGIGLPLTITPPAIRPVPGLKVYDSRPVSGQSTDETRVFTQTVVPMDGTLSHIPGISFTSFNPVAGRYETATAGPFPLTFHAEPATVTPSLPLPTSKHTVPAITNGSSAEREPRRGFIARWLGGGRVTALELLHVSGTVNAHIAPSRTSLVLFTLKKDSVIRITDRQDGWLRVEAPDGIGWIPAIAP